MNYHFRWHDHDICKALNVSSPTIDRVRKQFVFKGFEALLTQRRSRRMYSRKLNGEQEARMKAIAFSAAPSGYARWSSRLLADQVVQVKIIDSISHETVRHTLDDNKSKPWRREEWRIPAANAEFVFHMEDILDVYKNVPKPLLSCFCHLDVTKFCQNYCLYPLKVHNRFQTKMDIFCDFDPNDLQTTVQETTRFRGFPRCDVDLRLRQLRISKFPDLTLNFR